MEKVKLHSTKAISSDKMFNNLSFYEKDLILFCLEQWSLDENEETKGQAYIITHGNHKTAFIVGLN